MHPRVLKSLLWTFGVLPLPVMRAVGATAGWLLYAISNRRQRTARKNIALCFPEMPAPDRERLLRANLIELGKSAFEVGHLWTRGKARMARLVRRTVGEEKVAAAMARGKGMILAAPHLGAWEMVGIYCSMHYPMTGLYRALSDPKRRDVVREARQRFGGKMVPADKAGIRALYEALNRGEMIWIMVILEYWLRKHAPDFALS